MKTIQAIPAAFMALQMVRRANWPRATLLLSSLMLSLLCMNNSTYAGQHDTSHTQRSSIEENNTLWSQLASRKVTINGSLTSLENVKGTQGLYLKFWATWCKACLEEMPAFQEHYAHYNASLPTLAVSLGLEETPEAIAAVKKQFGLTMPIVTDEGGILADIIDLPGTPYHVVFDAQGTLLHRGYGLTPELEAALKTASINNPQKVQLDAKKQLKAKAKTQGKAENLPFQQGMQILFFTNIWCDWYLESTRPALAKECSQAVENMAQLVKEKSNLKVQGVISYLWSTEEDLEKYRNKYAVNFPTTIDKSNALFLKYNVTSFAEILILDNGQLIKRIDAKQQYPAIKASLLSSKFINL